MRIIKLLRCDFKWDKALCVPTTKTSSTWFDRSKSILEKFPYKTTWLPLISKNLICFYVIYSVYLFIYFLPLLLCIVSISNPLPSVKAAVFFFNLYCYEAMPFVLNKVDKSQSFNWWLLTVKWRETNCIFKLLKIMNDTAALSSLSLHSVIFTEELVGQRSQMPIIRLHLSNHLKTHTICTLERSQYTTFQTFNFQCHSLI